MNIEPNFQFIIIASLLTLILLTVIAVISYKLGKREKVKIINENAKMSKKENEINHRQMESSENTALFKEERRTNSDDKNQKENTLNGEKRVTLQELYSNRMNKEIKHTEVDNKKEGDRFSDFKFLKYTSKGYKPAIGDKESKVVRWR